MEFDNALLRMILEDAPVGIALLDFDRTVRYSNAEFRRIYGWDNDEIIGTVLPLPEHQRGNYIEMLADLRSGLRIDGVETVRVRKDGREFYARIAAAPVPDASGAPGGFIAIISATEENYSDQLELLNLEYLVEASTEFMCVASLDLKVVFINDPGRKMVGLHPDDDLSEDHLLDFFADHCRERLAKIFRSLQPGQAGVTVPFHLKNVQTGSLIPVSAVVYLVNDPHTGQPSSFGCVATSLVHEQVAQRQSQSSESAFQTLLQHVPVGVVLVDSIGMPFDCNKAVLDMLGYTAEEFKALPFSQHVYPEDLAHGRSLFLQLIAGTIDTYMTHKRLLHRDGRIIPTTMKVFLVREQDGRPKHTISIIALAQKSESSELETKGRVECALREIKCNSAMCQ